MATATGTTPAQTGTRPTGMTGGMRPPQQRQSAVAKLMQSWGALTSKQKAIFGVGALLLLVLVLAVVKINQATAYVPLYENALEADDMQDVTQALTEMGISYTKSQDDHVLVPPSKRVDALAALTKAGIPKHPFEQLQTSGTTGETHEQFTAEQQLMLERDLTLVLRQFNEVSDANVKLVIPSETAQFFSDQKQEAKAAVVLRLKPGYDSLPLNEAKSIVNLVAYSVPGLKPEDVQLTDTDGKLLSDMLKDRDNPMYSSNMIGIKKQYQAQYESQIKQILDPVLGPGKYALAVNVDLNWNQSQSQSQSVGNPELNTKGYVPVEEQITKEKYNKKGGHGSGVQQLGFNPGNNGSENPNYERSEKLQKNEIDRTVNTTTVTPGQVSRITASVLADHDLSPSAQRTLAASIKDAVGMNTERGDSINFGTLPFHQSVISEMSVDMNQPFGMRKDSAPVVSGGMVAKVLTLILIMATLFAGFWFFRQQKAKTEKAQLVMAAGPTATVSDISDLVNEKTGKVNLPQAAQTQVSRANQTEKLEILAKEKPTKVAELLKTTWLAEK